MTLFQWLSLSALALLLFRETLVVIRGGARAFALVRVVVWVAAAATIADPLLVHWLAVTLGIGLGVNLVLYLFVFAFIGASFFFYARTVRMQRQITGLVRHLAIQGALHGEPVIPDRADSPIR